MELNATRAISQLISVISYALDIDEGVKLFHAWRVSIFGAELAKSISLDERKNIFYASLLHDVGGIGLPNHIIHYLKKDEIPKEPGVFAHPLIGAEIVDQIPNLDKAARLILNHHEWYNGKGYPLGRLKDEIPKTSQVIRISDQMDILIRDESIHTRPDLIKAIDLSRDRQVSSDLIDYAVSLLEDEALYQDVIDGARLSNLFKNIKDDVGDIPIPERVDAVGIACEVFSQLIDTKHPYTIGHSKRVSRFSLLIALVMDLPHDELTKIKWAGLLHDIGKLGISRKLLDKPRSLTQPEYETIKQHAMLTREMLGTITDFEEIASIASADHERFDGTGYPEGLKGDGIPLGARIIATADAFDAMTSNRPYKRRLPIEEACKRLKAGAGTQFDPNVVKEAVPVLRNLKLVIG